MGQGSLVRDRDKVHFSGTGFTRARQGQGILLQERDRVYACGTGTGFTPAACSVQWQGSLLGQFHSQELFYSR